MNSIGFYIPQIDDSDLNVEIFEALNEVVERGEIEDAVVFFDDVQKNTVWPKFAMMDGAEVWKFKGTLVSTSLGVCNSARNAVNTFKLFHLYNREEKNLLQLLSVSEDTMFITRSDEDAEELHRLTGLGPAVQSDTVAGMIKELEEL